MSDGITLAAIEALPAPEIIEALDYEAILTDLIAAAHARFDDAGVPYTVGGLETDPVVIALQVAAFREMTLRARANDVARANLQAFARVSDLDHLASLYDVLRMPDETDDALRGRLAVAISGRSAGGPQERYRAVARGADVRVAETAIYQVDGGPQLELAVLATDNNGVPDQPLLDAVEAAVTAPGVLLVNDTIRVVSAVKTFVDVTVDAWMLPTGNAAVLTGLGAQLQAAWETEGGIGRDLNPSWINGRLFVGGVARLTITSPAAPIVAAPNEAISIQSVTISDRGVER